MDHAMPLQLANLLQFQQPERGWHLVPSLDDALRAALLGLDTATFAASKARCDALSRQAAQELLQEPALALRVDRLPFEAGATIVGIGDSLTDDFQSWLEILRHVCELRRPGEGLRIVNAAVGGQTTTLALGRFHTTLGKRPDWILCLLGVNDAVRIGSPAGKTLVSAEETARNLLALRELAAPSDARWVWLTPPTIDEEQMATDSFLHALGLTWRNQDLEAIGDVVRRQPEPVIDVQAVFGRPAAADFLLPDGIHPSLAGHKAIVRALIERLTS